MSQYNVNLLAGKETRLDVRGVFFMARSVSNAATLDVVIEVRGDGDRNDETFAAVEGGFKAKINRNKFDAVRVKASADCAMVYVISDNDVDFDFFAGANVNATIIAPDPLPVSNDYGSPGQPMTVVGLTIDDAPAAAIVDHAAVAVNDTRDLIAAAAVNRRSIRFQNMGPDAVALVSSTGTWAQRVLTLDAFDVFIEERAANLAWYGITDAGKSASVTYQEVTA